MKPDSTSDRKPAVMTALVVVGSATFAFGASFLLPQKWMVNDNPLISALLVEGYAVHFSSIILTAILHLLKSHISENVPWFSLVLVASHATSLSFITMSIIEAHRWGVQSQILGSQKARLLYWLFPIVYAALYLKCLLLLDYSATAILLGVNACIIFTIRVIGGRQSDSVMVAAALSICLAAMIRTEALTAILILSLPVLLIFAFVHVSAMEAKRQLRPVFRTLGFLTLLLGPAIAVVAVDSVYKSTLTSPAYQTYIEHLAAVKRLESAKYSYRKSGKNLLDGGIDIDNERKYWKWIFFDEEVYSKDRLDSLLLYLDPPSFFENVQSIEAWRSYSRRAKQFAVLFLVVAVFGWTLTTEKKFGKAGVLSAVLISVVIAYPFIIGALVFFLAKLPWRISLPLFLSSLGVSWISLILLQSWMARYARRGDSLQECGVNHGAQHVRVNIDLVLQMAASGMMVFTLISLLRGAAVICQNNADALDTYSRQVINLERIREDGIYLIHFDSIDIASISPLIDLDPGINFIFGGWLTFSPKFYDVLELELGIEKGSEILRAFSSRNDAHIVVKPDYADLFTGWGESRVRLVHVNDLADDVAVYRAVSINGHE